MAFDLGKEISTQIKTRVFKKVVGGVGDFVRGIPSTGNSSDTAKLKSREKSITDHLSFPLDVESGRETGNHGHYIMFFINEQNHAKLKFGDRVRENDGINSLFDSYKKMGGKNLKSVFNNRLNVFDKVAINGQDIAEHTNVDIAQMLLNPEFKSSDIMGGLDGGDAYYASGGARSGDTLTSGGPAGNIKFKGISVRRAPTSRLKTAISMYMPMDVSTSYESEYTNTEIGMFSESVREIMSDFVNQNYSGMGNKIVNMDSAVIQAIEEVMLATASALPGMKGSRELDFMRKGRIYSNRMELAYQGLKKRSFTYTFKMIPRSLEEAKEIKAIIFAFKHNMLPEIDGSADKGRKLIVPNTFDITYMYNGSENEFLHKIATCVLANMDVKYGGSKYQTFEGEPDGAPVVETTIALTFSEMEPITREKVIEGF